MVKNTCPSPSNSSPSANAGAPTAPSPVGTCGAPSSAPATPPPTKSAPPPSVNPAITPNQNGPSPNASPAGSCRGRASGRLFISPTLFSRPFPPFAAALTGGAHFYLTTSVNPSDIQPRYLFVLERGSSAPAFSFIAESYCRRKNPGLPLPANGRNLGALAQFWCNVSPFRMNTCKSVSKQRTLTPFRMNTYAKTGEGGLIVNHQSANDSSGSVLSVSLWQIPQSAPAAARNPAKSPAPTADASGSADTSGPSGSVPSSAGTLPPNACTPAPARETPHSPDTAERPTMRNTPHRPRATAGRAPQTFPEQTSPAPANSPSHTRSCLFPDRYRYKS